MNCRKHLNNTVTFDRAESGHLLLDLIVPRRKGVYTTCRRTDQQVSALVKLQWIVCPPGKRMRNRYIVRYLSVALNECPLPLANRTYGGSQEQGDG